MEDLELKGIDQWQRMDGVPETTQFEDAHRQMTGKLTREQEVREQHKLEENVEKMIIDAYKEKEMDDKDFEELEELEDELDEDFLAYYREKLEAEMKEKLSAEKFGEIYEITAKQYKDVVSDPSITIIIHLSQDYLPDCKVLHHRFKQLAKKFKEHKFCRIRATDAIHGYPDRFCPTVIVYKGGECFKQLVGMETLGGHSLTAEQLEWTLAEQEVLTTELEENPFDGGARDEFAQSVRRFMEDQME
ncbi:hypothetical protein ADUPG1_008192 [Aduncisulcus paluster]|uniref:Phosducin domain-containing protein n=1 Tax=Aduncisulcus paluster TaxID=2918883 RepID=A0ABQ5KV74_9EUKA|nr:hypothetical protein ADUPG1_008192 [Aduncisulcus paluster]